MSTASHAAHDARTHILAAIEQLQLAKVKYEAADQAQWAEFCEESVGQLRFCLTVAKDFCRNETCDGDLNHHFGEIATCPECRRCYATAWEWASSDKDRLTSWVVREVRCDGSVSP